MAGSAQYSDIAVMPHGLGLHMDAAIDVGDEFDDLQLRAFADDDGVFSDDESFENKGDNDDGDEDHGARAMESLVDDVKGRSEFELARSRSTLLSEPAFVDAVTESKLPAGATQHKHLNVQWIKFAPPKPLYRFSTTQQWRQTILGRGADGKLCFAPDATQKIITFLFAQHPVFPTQIALSTSNSFVMEGQQARAGQVWVANKEFVCAGIRDGCPTRLSAGFTVKDCEVIVDCCRAAVVLWHFAHLRFRVRCCVAGVNRVFPRRNARLYARVWR
jgi:hypothetical protein